jgi:hypothetical protein
MLQCSTCVACSSKSILSWVRKNYRNVGQHVLLCTWVFTWRLFSICSFITLNLVQIWNVQFVSLVAKKSIWLRAMKHYRKVGQMCSCAPGCLRVDIFSIYHQWLSKNLLFSTWVSHSSECFWPRVIKIYWHVGQKVLLFTWGFLFS